MEEFFQQLTNGLAIGGIYALIALGYTMVYGILRLINFAHGDLFTLGAYLGLSILTSMGLGTAASGLLVALFLILMAMGLVGFTGVVLEKMAYRPLRNSNRLAAVVSALGASIFIQNAIMLFMFATAVLLMFLLHWFIHKTKTGTAVRAVAIDQGAAKLMGIDVNRVISIVFLIGPALGGAAGVMVGLYYGQITYDMGFSFGLKAFTAAILGGIGNIPGAMLGGVLLGVIEALGAAYLSTAWKDAFAFMVLILILIFRPTGLLGERVAEKV